MRLWNYLGMAFKPSSIVVYVWDMLTAAPLHSANVYMCGIHFHWGPAVISLGKFKRLNAHCRSFLWVYLKRFCVSCPTYFEPLSSQRQVGSRVQSANAKIWEIDVSVDRNDPSCVTWTNGSATLITTLSHFCFITQKSTGRKERVRVNRRLTIRWEMAKWNMKPKGRSSSVTPRTWGSGAGHFDSVTKDIRKY